jgi:hypothetical protein
MRNRKRPIDPKVKRAIDSVEVRKQELRAPVATAAKLARLSAKPKKKKSKRSFLGVSKNDALAPWHRAEGSGWAGKGQK